MISLQLSHIIGGKCGSTALDRNFYKLMSERLGPAFDALPAKRKGPGSTFMGYFEVLKRNFGLDSEDTTHELELLGIRSSQVDPQYYDEDAGVVIISEYVEIQASRFMAGKAPKLLVLI
jgi:hypothetical protein